MKNIYILSALLFFNINIASAEVKWQTINGGDAVSCLESDANGNFQDTDLDQCIQNLEVRHYFKHDSQKVTGCHLVTSRGTHIKDLPLLNCLANNKKYSKSYQNQNGEYKCSLHTEFKNLLIEEIDFKDNFQVCSRGIDFSYYWIGSKRETCGAFKDSTFAVKLNSPSRCDSSKKHYITAPSGKTELVDSFDGIESMTAEAIFQKIEDDKKALVASLSQSEQEIIEINSERPGSYRTLFKTGQTDSIKEQISSSCFNYIKETFESGKSFYSKTLVDAAYPITEGQTRTGDQDTSFYHWTDADALLDILETSEQDRKAAHKEAIKNQTYSAFFTFLRNRMKNGERSKDQDFWYQQFYLAEDPESSGDYGSKLLRLDFKKSCKTVNTTESDIFIKTLKEIDKKTPGLLESCQGAEPNNTFGWSSGGPVANGTSSDQAPMKGIFILIAEESGIEMLDYTDGLFFQMISPTCIEKTSHVR